MKRRKMKLVLRHETLRRLDTQALEQAAGGGTISGGFCHSVNPCNSDQVCLETADCLTVADIGVPGTVSVVTCVTAGPTFCNF